MNPRGRGRGLVENEEQGKNKKMKSIVFVVEEQEQKEGSETGKSEEQDENKKMKSIVVEKQEQEQEQEQEEGSESGFVDLDPDTLRNVLKRVDVFTLGRAACVNKMWRKAAWDNRLWQQIFTLHYVLKRVEHSQLQLF